MHPEFKKLFTEQMTVEDNDLLVDEEKLRHHGNIVMEGLGAAVESLDDSVFLSNVLVTMGESHARHNVKPEMVIVRLFKKYLPENYKFYLMSLICITK